MKDNSEESFQKEENTSGARYEASRRDRSPAEQADRFDFVALLEVPFDEAW